jgi:hypothetical protein
MDCSLAVAASEVLLWCQRSVHWPSTRESVLLAGDRHGTVFAAVVFAASYFFLLLLRIGERPEGGKR